MPRIATSREMLPMNPFPRSWVRSLAIGLLAAVFLSASGALDTDRAAMGSRVAYWVLMALTSTAALERVHHSLSVRYPSHPSWKLRTGGLILLLLPMSLLGLLLCKALFGGPLSLGRFGALLPGMIGIVAALQFLLMVLRETRRAPTDAVRAIAPAGIPEEISASLPLPMRYAKIHALKAEDHYVRFFTTAGTAMVRMRLTDAVASLDSHTGIRPHRSWWVALDSVVSVERLGRRTYLCLVDGQQVPVTRKVSGAVRGAA